jgi:uncharacterized damage-inducible protein DinB
MIRIPKPQPEEHHEYYARYIKLVGDDALGALRAQSASTPRLLSGLSEAQAMHRYAAGKWSVKEVVGHITDGERVFSYRALRIARADTTPLPGFDEEAWVPAAHFDRRPLPDLVADYQTVRAATVALFASLDEDALTRIGTANDQPVSVRALAHMIAGHELHHIGILRERYGLS